MHWRPSNEQQKFIRRYSKAIEAGDAAIFAGAGLSRPAGFVDWKGLLKEIASDLGLDIDKESDLVAVAQYHLNTKQNRSRLNQALIEEFMKATHQTRNHYLLARLPIHTVWTTNYDQLIEQAFEATGKVADVKLSQENLAQTRRGREVVLYKMHGCVTQPQDAVLTKDDYENYERKKPLFVENLKGDLISKTFLFLGFSFSDPNVDYVLSRIRVLLDKNQREHFAIMRRPSRPRRLVGRAAADFEYEQRKLELRISDLRRFAIETILIDEYSDVELLLEAISSFAHRKNVFVSGSARDYGLFGKNKLDELSRAIGRRLIEEGYNVVSGFGVGIGEHCVVEALKALYYIKKGDESDRLIVRPFPRAQGVANEQSTLNRRHREDLISRSGAVVFMAGNRANASGVIEHSRGVREEFEIARQLNRFIIPIAATGYVAEEIWTEMMADLEAYYKGINVRDQMNILADPRRPVADLVEAVLDIIRLTVKAREI